ncbi:MAG TPA: carboxypeptidase regulatory-like domain-containing protein, partial [Acidimicrobiales bacterium]
MTGFIRRPFWVALLGCVIGLAPLANVALSSAASATTVPTVATYAESPGAPPNFIFPYDSCQFFSTGNVSQFQYLMYRPLYSFGNGDQPSLNPALSLATTPTFANNNTTVTLNLKNYQWSNGETVTAQDVVFWMNLMKVEPTNYCGYATGGIPDDVASITTPNSSTVVFQLKGSVNPQWFIYNELSQITPLPMAWDVTTSGEAPGTELCANSDWNSVVTQPSLNAAANNCVAVWTYLEAQSNQVTSTYPTNPLWQVVDGPWHLTAMDDVGNVTFEPNPSYSGPVKPTLSQFKEVPYASNADEFRALLAGSVTVGYLPPEDVALPAVSATQAGPNPTALASNYNIYSVGQWGINYAPYNFKSSGDNGYDSAIFKQLYFRQAMQMLVDQTTYIAEVYKGYATPAYGPIPPGSNNPFTGSFEQANPYPYNPVLAESLLAQNGWTVNLNGTDVCNDASKCGVPVGTPLSFTFDYPTGNPSYAQVVQAEIDSWKAAGINVTGSAGNFNQTINGFFCGASTCPAELGTWGGGWLYAPDVYPSGESLFSSTGGFNPGSYSNPSVDALINSTTSTGANLDAYANAVATQLPVVWQPMPSNIVEVQNTLQGAAPINPLGYITPENWSFASSPVPTALISGTVTSASSSGALSGICATAYSTSAGGTMAWPGATTAADGTYSITGLPLGTYNVEFTTGCGSTSNYVSQWNGAQATMASSTPVTVTSAGASSVNATMGSSGEIAGSVTSGATPVAQVCVNAYALNSTTPVGAMGLTDALGNYVIAALPPGSYTVNVDATCGGTVTSTYVSQFINSVGVTAGATTTENVALALGGTLSGTVTNVSGTGLPNVCVQANPVGGGSFGSTQTASDGTYTLTVAPDSYTVQFNNCGSGSYVSQYYNGTTAGAPSSSSATSVTVTVGSSATGISAQMAAGTTISGTVTGSSGAGLSNVCVQALHPGGGAYGNTTTASDGTYTVTNLAPGSYTVQFTNCASGNYASQYYNGTTAGAPSTASATTLTVTVSSPATAINAVMTANSTSISGIVTDSSGAGLSNICVQANPVGGETEGNARSASDGTYTVTGLAPGSYNVFFSNCGSGNYGAQWYNGTIAGASSLSSAATFTVTVGSRATGINAQMTVGTTIAGTVTDSSGARLSYGCVDVFLASGGYVGEEKTASNGTYSMNVAPGSYTVEFYSCGSGNYVSQYYNDTTAGASSYSSATSFTVTLDSPALSINAQMAAGAAISGTVTDASGTPLSNVCVNANPVSGSSDGNTTTASDGTYTVTGLAPGSYTVQFFNCGSGNYASQFYNGTTTGTASFSSATSVPVTVSSPAIGINAEMTAGATISGTVTDSGDTPVAN